MRYLFIIIFLCSCSYEVSNPVMPLRDYTVNTGKTYYIKGDASVEDIINVINKNWHSRRQYKVIPLDFRDGLFEKIAEAITHFLWVDLDFRSLTKNTGIEIPDDCFSNKNIRSVILSDSITNIGISAFANCKQLDTIRLSNRGTIIKENAFANNKVLTTIILQGSNDIKSNAFGNTSIMNLIIEKNYTTIDNYAFDNASISNLQYNDIKTEIQDWSLSNVINLYLPSVTNLAKQGFTKDSILGVPQTKIKINQTL